MGSVWDGTLAGIVGAITGGLAGYVATRIANSANRKAARLESRLDAIDTTVESLCRDSVAYWKNPSRDQPSESRILGYFEDIGSKIGNLSGFGISAETINSAQFKADRLYDLVTDDPFQSDRWTPRAEIIEEVRKSCRNISSTFHPNRR